MPASNAIEIRITISAQEYLLMYKGIARDVSATAVDGRRVRFPAHILQKFVTRDGVHGRFLIQFSRAGKFESITRLG